MSASPEFAKEAASIGLTARAARCTWGVLEELIAEALEEQFQKGRNSGLKQGEAQRAVMQDKLNEYIDKTRLAEDLLVQAETDARAAIDRAETLEQQPCFDSMNELQRLVGEWGIVTFPHSTIATMHEHLRREAEELERGVTRWQRQQRPVKEDVVWQTTMVEVADVLLLALGLAHRKRFSLFDVIQYKFRECQTREWGEPDADGVSEHIREAS